MKPKISICVPNLNTRPFLPERFETIFNQTFQDWELIAYDSFSNDGAWEYIQEVAAREPRMRISQGPREGTPRSWNPCIRQARGEYVYIATSDDTMATDCLEKLAAALDKNPDCDIAHCPPRYINEHGKILDSQWETKSMFGRTTAELLQHPHVRRAPYDGLLHLTGESVFISITQLLIRRSLFDCIGFFEQKWGGVGDFEWDMRATLVANTVHVPDTWGGWRLHAAQATASSGYGSPEHRAKLESMMDHAIASVEGLISADLRNALKSEWRNYFNEQRQFMHTLQSIPSRAGRISFLGKQALSGSRPAREYLRQRVFGNSDDQTYPRDLICRWLEKIHVSQPLKPIPK